MSPMTEFGFVTAALMIIMGAIAVYTDVRMGKINNALTAPCAILGLVLNAVGGGKDGLLLSLGGIGAGLGIFLIASLLFGRILGGGDIKLLIAIGAIQGATFLGWTVVYMAIIGGILAIVVSVARRDFVSSLKRLWSGVVLLLFARVKVDVADASSPARLPYAIPIALGSLVALYVLKLQ